jgi:hypothetical protein
MVRSVLLIIDGEEVLTEYPGRNSSLQDNTGQSFTHPLQVLVRRVRGNRRRCPSPGDHSNRYTHCYISTNELVLPREADVRIGNHLAVLADPPLSMSLTFPERFPDLFVFLRLPH